jgi:hypothetical protein
MAVTWHRIALRVGAVSRIRIGMVSEWVRVGHQRHLLRLVSLPIRARAKRLPSRHYTPLGYQARHELLPRLCSGGDGDGALHARLLVALDGAPVLVRARLLDA